MNGGPLARLSDSPQSLEGQPRAGRVGDLPRVPEPPMPQQPGRAGSVRHRNAPTVVNASPPRKWTDLERVAPLSSRMTEAERRRGAGEDVRLVERIARGKRRRLPPRHGRAARIESRGATSSSPVRSAPRPSFGRRPRGSVAASVVLVASGTSVRIRSPSNEMATALFRDIFDFVSSPRSAPAGRRGVVVRSPSLDPAGNSSGEGFWEFKSLAAGA